MAILSEGVVDASCASHFGKYGVWRCYLGQYAAPFIKVTSLFLQNQVSASISTIVTSEGTKVKGLSLRVLACPLPRPCHALPQVFSHRCLRRLCLRYSG